MIILTYVLKTTISLLLLYLLFSLTFKKEGLLRFNRYYLLFSLIASFLLPFMTLNINLTSILPTQTYSNEFTTPSNQSLEVMPHQKEIEYAFTAQSTTEQPIAPMVLSDTPNLKSTNYFEFFTWSFLGIYCLGVVVLLLSFLYQLWQTLLLIRQNERKIFSKAKLIQHGLEIMPFSIFNYIIINKNHYNDKELEYVLLHEMEHINQKHSFDILLIEILKIVFWVNPLVWIYEKEIKQNHEYLADRGVLAHGIQTYEYQLILLNSSLGVPKFNIVNNFNKSHIKKRITMMTSKSIRKLSIWKLLLIVPVVITILFACSKPSGTKAIIEETVSSTEITDYTKYIELNTPYDWVSYQGANLFCKGTYTITKINADGTFEGFQINHTYHAHIPVTGKLTKNEFEIYTGSPWNEIWSIKSSENGKLYGEMFADYKLARTNKLTFYMAKKIGFDELMPASLSQPGEEISKKLHLKLNEKYFYETFGDNGELAMTGWFMITNFDKTTQKISGDQWNYIGDCPGVFSGSLDDNNLTINIGEPWNEVWKAKLEGDLLKGTLEMKPTAVGFVHQTQSWVMSTKNKPIISTEKAKELNLPFNVARFSKTDETLNNFLKNNLNYPIQAKEAGIEGRVYVSFIVKADGSIANLSVARKVNPLLDEEALRLVSLTNKKWAPAFADNKPIDSEYLMPIVFKIDNKQTINTASGILKGNVTDKDTKEALASVNIVEVDKNGKFITGTVTDTKGDYVLKIKDVNNSIQASFKGYKISTFPIEGRSTDNIILERAH